MEETELIQLWKRYDAKLQMNLSLNRKNAEDLTHLKIRTLLGSMRPIKLFAILIGLIWAGVIDTLIFQFASIASPFFIFSAVAQVLLTKMAIGIYLYQLILIHQTDVSSPIVETQVRLARLRTTTLLVVRILLLQLPLWTIFYWNKGMLENGNLLLTVIQLVVTLLMSYLAYWLFINLKYENRDRRWFKLLLNGAEWEPVMKSFDLLSQTAEFEH